MMRYFLSMNASIPLDFTHVVDESEQLPLDIDLGFRTDGEVVPAFLDAEVGKDRREDGQTPGLDLPAFRCVDPRLDGLDQVGMQTADLDGQKAAGWRGLAQAFGSHRTDRTILPASAINSIDPVAVALAARCAFQDPGLRTDIDLAEGIAAKVCLGELRFSFCGSCFAMNAILEARLLEEAGISFAKLQVRDVGIQLFCLAERQIGQAVIIAVCTELPALKVTGRFANGLHVLFATL